jgi:hypothetical protein
MDPNAALSEIRRIIANPEGPDVDLFRLVELVEGLDQWVSRGGFLPEGWGGPRNLTHSLTDALVNHTVAALEVMKDAVAVAAGASDSREVFDALLPVSQALAAAAKRVTEI